MDAIRRNSTGFMGLLFFRELIDFRRLWRIPPECSPRRLGEHSGGIRQSRRKSINSLKKRSPMKPVLFLRIASILTFVHAVGHTLGGVFGTPPPGDRKSVV